MNQKLLKLADYLETVSPNRFNMLCWATGDLNECGTAGCAAGWATQIFPELKLNFEPDDDGLFRDCWLGYNSFYGFRALAAFFEISIYSASMLFDPIHYVDISLPVVIERIREYATRET